MSVDIPGVAEALRAFERGEIVVVTDDDDRENEGDLIVAAVHCTPEKMAFIVRHTSGIVCAPMPGDIARKLRLDPMVAVNDAPHSTAFTISVDFRHGTTTGISAEERTATVRALANGNVGPEDFVRPGHVFPLVAREGGVLMRSGHTEAAVDLCRLSGLPPVGVICELVNDDGTVMRGPQVKTFAETHGLKQVSVADLIAWRQRTDRLVEQVEEAEIETRHGRARAVSFSVPFDPMQHLAVVYGDIRDGENIPVRLHVENVAADLFGLTSRLGPSEDRIASHGRGIIVYLRDGSVGVNTGAASLRSRPPEEDTASARRRQEEWREIGLGAQILHALGVSSIRLLASRERRYIGLEGFGIKITETEIL
ncbi:MAG: 3,4-dihydroxy-2-butanone-4-phosphate synthase [Hyphomicrobiaceae bacterium]|nr:3,4-dihydroxy-2-butanone-4-phosphate synthase [Hyphomicrobiaceae bacterium]